MRDLRIDVIKGLMILLVVWGHLPRMGVFKEVLESAVFWIYHFHMPIFVFITGYLFGRRHGGVRELIVVTDRMLKPYLFAAILSVTLYYVAMQMGVSTTATVPVHGLWTGCKLILIGRAGGALWYLYTYGIIELLCVSAMLLVNKASKLKNCEPWLILVVVIGGASLARMLGLGVGGFNLLPYFFVGFFAYRLVGELHGSWWFALPIMGFVLARGKLSGGLLDGCMFGFVVSVFCFLLRVSECLINRLRPLGCVLSFLGCHTLSLLMFHNFISGGIRPLSNLILRYESSGIGLNVVMMLLIVFGCLALEYIIKKTVLQNLFYPMPNKKVR